MAWCPVPLGPARPAIQTTYLRGARSLKKMKGRRFCPAHIPLSDLPVTGLPLLRVPALPLLSVPSRGFSDSFKKGYVIKDRQSSRSSDHHQRKTFRYFLRATSDAKPISPTENHCTYVLRLHPREAVRMQIRAVHKVIPRPGGPSAQSPHPEKAYHRLHRMQEPGNPSYPPQHQKVPTGREVDLKPNPYTNASSPTHCRQSCSTEQARSQRTTVQCCHPSYKNEARGFESDHAEWSLGESPQVVSTTRYSPRVMRGQEGVGKRR